MFYGYALYYKDKDGYERPLMYRHAPSEIVFVTPYKNLADKWFDNESQALHNELNPTAYKVTRGMLWWKKEEIVRPDPLSHEEFRFKAQVYNTLFIKKVAMA